MKKRLLAILLCVCMVSTMLPAPAIAASVCPHESGSWQLWESTTSLPAAAGNYVLKDTVRLSGEYIWQTSGAEMNICLNGKDIIQTATGKRVFNVKNGAVMNIYDCQNSGEITDSDLTVAATAGGLVRVEGNGTFRLYGGHICGGEGTGHGGAVYVTNATFEMHGGVIRNNTTIKSGSNHTGGGITGNGGAVIKLMGGTIRENSAGNGGGVTVQASTDELVIGSVTITGNTASANAGGVYIGKHKSVKLTGSPNITGNQKGTAASNVLVVSTASEARPINLQENLNADAVIGIDIYNSTASNVLVSAGVTAKTVSCYRVDGADKTLEYKNGALSVVTKPTTAAGHANTAGYTKCDHDKKSFAPWYATNSLPVGSGSYYLTDNVNLTDKWAISEGQEITLCLNGKNITQTVKGKQILEVIQNSGVHICDCTAKTENSVYTAGKITGADVTTDGAAVDVVGGTFTLADGMITENITTTAGGGIAAGTNAVVNILGGQITKNKAANGGGIIVQGTNPQVLLKDVSITGNEATSNAGGIYVGYNNATTTKAVTLSGKVNITGNVGGANKIKANLQIMNNVRVIHEKDLDAASSIGVRNNAGTNLVGSGATETTKKCYISDSNDKYIKRNEGVLTLENKPTDFATHKDTAGYDKCGHGNTTWEPWYETDSLPTTPGSYYLAANVNLTDTWKVIAGQEITLCLNGKNITQTTNGKQIALVKENSKVHICDCTAKTTGDVYTAGMLTGANVTVDGAAIYVGGATLTFADGIITGNTTTVSGGGIAAGGGAKAYITGGLIAGNTAKNGGGMIIQGANPQVLLKNVTIRDNTATANAGGVYLGYNVAQTTGNALTLSGKVTIKNNTVGAAKNNLFVTTGRVWHHDSLAADSAVGIKAMATPDVQLVKTGATQADLACYTSDTLGRAFQLRNTQEMWLVVADSAQHTAHNPDQCGHSNVTWSEWGSDSSLPTANGHYYLIADVNLTAAWNVGDGKDITICLNGNDITQLTNGQRVIRVGNSTLNICDCKEVVDNGTYKSGKITGGKTNATDSGNAGAILITNGGTVRLYSGAVTGNESQGLGGAVVVQKQSKLELRGGKITGNTSGKQGGAVYVTGATLEVYDGELSGNIATGSGGAVYNNGGTVTVKGGTIKNNESKTGGGGGICSAGDKAILTIEGGAVSESKAKLDGVGIRVDGGKFTMSGGEVRGNGETGGPAGGIRLATAVTEATISGGTIAGNKAGNAAGVLASCDLTISGGKIKNNSASGNGGGIYISDANLTVTGGEIVGNYANTQGAGIFAIRAQVKLDGGKISGNEAASHGGGIALRGAKLELVSGAVNSNLAGGGGAGIYAIANGDAQSAITISGGNVNNNSAKLDGSGIRIEGTDEKKRGAFVITGGEIGDNKSQTKVDAATGEKVFMAAGGGVMAKYCDVTIGGAARIVRNEAGNAAGVLLNTCDVTVNGGVIAGNKGAGNGAGMYIAYSQLKMTDGNIRLNESVGNGAGIYAIESDMTVAGGAIYSNKGGMGAGIYNLGGKLKVSGGDIRTNDAYKVGGGGIYSTNRTDGEKVIAQAAVTISGGTIRANTSASDGSGVRVDSGSFKMTGGEIRENKSGVASAAGLRLVDVKGAEISGGIITKNSGANAAGIYVRNSELTISGGEISHNHATGSGAGIMTSESVVKFTGGEISANTADGDAGGIYLINSELMIDGGKVLKNRAGKVGAGIRAINGAEILLNDGAVSGNIAAASCGGIMVESLSHLDMKGGTISDNITVNYGGGIYVNREASATISGGQIKNNAARKSGGGVYISVDAKASVSGVTISGNDAVFGGGMVIAGDTKLSGGKIVKNTSQKEGAGVYVTDAKLTMTGGTIDGNVTKYNGGGLCVRGVKGLLVMSGSAAVTNNVCNESGGGILVQGGGKLIMHDGKVNGNLAPNGGGGIRLHNCAAEIHGGQINENTSYGQGAGIYTNLSLIIKDAEVCDNKIENKANIATRTSAAIRTYNESTLVMENVKVTGNTCDGRAGAMEIAYNVNAIVKNCRFENNSATERGGAFSIYREGILNMENCTVKGNQTSGNGGAFSFDAYGTVNLQNCEITNNEAGAAGVAYVNTKGRISLENCVVKNNSADSKASVIYANGDVVLSDSEVTDNKGATAILLDNDGQDTESYLPGVYEIMGNTVVFGNQGGDLELVNNAFVNIPGSGLGNKAKIRIKTQDSDITRWVVGPYAYESEGETFLLTQGDRSLEDAFYGDGTQAADGSTTAAMLIGGGAVALIALAAILVLALKKKKK